MTLFFFLHFGIPGGYSFFQLLYKGGFESSPSAHEAGLQAAWYYFQACSEGPSFYDSFAGKTMRKPKGIILVLAFVVCAASVQVARAQEQPCNTAADCDDTLFCTGIESCSSETSTCVAGGGDPCAAGETCVEETDECAPAAGCEIDDDCADDVFCNGDETCAEGACLPGSNPCAASETCVEATDECAGAAGCVSDDECDDGVFCNGVELCADGECVPGTNPCEQGETCEENIDECTSPECVIDADCAEGEICSLNVCVDASGCVLTIKPAKVHINTMSRPVERRFRIIGSEGFDPRAAIDFGTVTVRSAAVNSKGVLKVLATIPAGSGLPKGPVRVSVGECVGEILLK
jgi:hypothetical protein